MHQPQSSRKSLIDIYRNHKVDFFIFGVAITIRIIALLLSAQISGLLHADGYYEIGYNLAHGNGYSFASQAPYFIDSERTPGLPFLLYPFMLLPNGAWIFILLQILIGSSLPLLAKRIFTQAGTPSKIATGMSIALALEPVGILLSIKILTDTFFTFFFLIFFILLQRFISLLMKPDIYPTLTKIAAVAGLALGCATLFRPSTLYMPLLALMLLAVKPLRNYRGMKVLAIFALTFLLCVLPWVYRNWQLYGVASFSSIKETALYVELAPAVLAVQEHTDLKTASKNFFTSHGFSEQPYISIADAKRFRKEAIKTILPYPGALMTVALTNMTAFMIHDGAADLLGTLGFGNQLQSTREQLSLAMTQPMPKALREVALLVLQTPPLWGIILVRVAWFILAALCAFGVLYRCFKKRFDILSITCILLIGYFLLTTISNGFGVNARFRFPVNSLLTLFTVQSLLLFHSSMNRQNQKNNL
jgi:hypothetical protein